MISVVILIVFATGETFEPPAWRQCPPYCGDLYSPSIPWEWGAKLPRTPDEPEIFWDGPIPLPPVKADSSLWLFGPEKIAGECGGPHGDMLLYCAHGRFIEDTPPGAPQPVWILDGDVVLFLRARLVEAEPRPQSP